MNVSALEEYGLRCAVQLASLPEGHTLSAPEIAEREGLSIEYVSKFMLLLKRADLVRTVRGMKGGFALTRSPETVSLKEVFDALSSKKRESAGFCKAFSGKSETCVRSSGCAIRPFWELLSTYVEEFTTRMTLNDLIQSEATTLQKTKGIAAANVESLRKMNVPAFEKEMKS
jgi:Rrf2 family protein